MPSPRYQTAEGTTDYRLPETTVRMDTPRDEGTICRMCFSGILQKHKVRSFGSCKLVKPYHIGNKATKTYREGIGVAYGLDNQRLQDPGFINGSTCTEA